MPLPIIPPEDSEIERKKKYSFYGRSCRTDIIYMTQISTLKRFSEEK